jgi:hypothetical protein
MSDPAQLNQAALNTTHDDSAFIVSTMQARRERLQEALRPLPKDSRAASRTGRLYSVQGKAQAPIQGTPQTQVEPQAKLDILLPLGKTLLAKWWSQHPARIGIDLAEQAITKQGSEHPIGLLAVGAALGCAVVIVKPWRRIGLASLLVSVIGAKSAGSLSKALDIAKAVTQAK